MMAESMVRGENRAFCLGSRCICGWHKHILFLQSSSIPELGLLLCSGALDQILQGFDKICSVNW
jgi:hypothetical protein